METNSQLKQKIVEVVTQQIKNNTPSATRETFDRLKAAGCSPDKALEKIAMVLVEDILNALHGKTFDQADYTRRLKTLQ